jgi:hypothetical protein
LGSWLEDANPFRESGTETSKHIGRADLVEPGELRGLKLVHRYHRVN